MTSYGPEDRALLETQGRDLFDEAVAAGGLSCDDPSLTEGGARRGALDLLVDLGLLQVDTVRESYQAQDPTGVASRVVSPLGHEGARLIEESSRWAGSLGALTQTWRRSPMVAGRGPFVYLRGEAIAPFVSSLAAETETEVLTAQPQAGRDPQTLAASALRTIDMLDRGCTMRTLYQHSARRSSVTHRYVSAVTERGAEVRTLDEFFNRLMIFDRRVAVIPGEDDLRVAVVVREPSVVAYLLDVFERAWERGRPFTNHDVSMLRGIADEQRAMTIRMLIEGHSDLASAKRLGVSPRTYAGYVADLKTEFEADTRFQLGYLMGRLGVSGRESRSEDS